MADMPDALRARVNPIYSPLLSIVPVSHSDPITDDETAIFTSSYGVLNAPKGAGRRAYCIGTATTERAKQHGWLAQMAGHTADEVVATLTEHPVDHKLVHIRGQHTRGNVVARLQAAGKRVRDCVVYEQLLLRLSDAARNAISREELTIVPLFSPRTAGQFASEVSRTTSIHVVALSDSVAEAAKPVHSSSVAVRPDATAMYEAIEQAIGAG
ncbi:uroporphyrinogen III methyltransferase [Tateyamaria omphalii]|nr:uroporphyrinogen III methyltransferase [Tateyamaria omphalii]